MTWTYDPELITDAEDGRLMEVRFLVGDKDDADHLMQDEEINLILLQFPPVADKPAWLAAAHTCDAIAGMFGRRMQQSIGPLSRAAEQQWEHYRQMAADFRAMYASDGLTTTGMSGITPASPVLGGGGRTYLGTGPDFAHRENA